MFSAAVHRRSESRIRVECAASIRSQNRNPSTPRQNRWSLDGMTALVTRGTSGVGRAVLEELVELGARVHTCVRNVGELQCCLSEWGERGYGINGSVCDVSIREQRVNLIENVSSLFGGNQNILANNVGRNIRKPTVNFTAEEFSFLMAINFESVFHLCQLAHPLLKASGTGSVVFVSSVSGFVSLKFMSTQAATKGAINQLTRSLACEWAGDNIRCNAVAPWYIKTSVVEQGELVKEQSRAEALSAEVTQLSVRLQQTTQAYNSLARLYKPVIRNIENSLIKMKDSSVSAW